MKKRKLVEIEKKSLKHKDSSFSKKSIRSGQIRSGQVRSGEKSGFLVRSYENSILNPKGPLPLAWGLNKV